MPRFMVLCICLCIYSFLCLNSFAFSNIWESSEDCSSGHFQCDDGQCILLQDRCDNYTNCIDGSDEKNCNKNFDVYNSDFSNSHILSIPFDLSLNMKCGKHEFKCKNHRCIPKVKFCDLNKDCTDGSDEYDNCVQDLDCRGRFRCNDRHCVFNKWVCDGVKDCPDGSDEWNCGANKTSSASDCKIEKSQFFCKNQRCIGLNLVCNKKDDCGDGSDEGAGCTSYNCSSVKCDHECKQTPNGSVCTCKPGYKLQNDNRTCKDINECETYGICDQVCINSPGSYSCACQKDYYLENKKTCRTLSEATIVFSTKTEVIGMYSDSKMNFTYASNLNRAVGVAINGEHVYWSQVEKTGETIVRKIPHRIFHESIVTEGLSEISDIAVDWITENIYFADQGFNRIGICSNNGTNCTVLIDQVKSKGIALLPTQGKMYWTDEFSSPRIAVSGMDGKNIRTFVSENLEWPASVAIDYPNERLYWADTKLKIIESIRLDGSDRRHVLHELIQEPYSLAIFENKLYWSDWGSNTIQSCNKFSGKDWKILYRTRNNPYGIHIDHSAIKPKIDNPCKLNPCSQLCMLNENEGYTCACTLDKKLNADNHTCQEMKDKKHLLIFIKNIIINYYHGLLGKPKVTFNSFFISGVTSDPLSGQVIVAVATWLWTEIKRYDPISNTFENIIKFSFPLEEIAFDHIGNNLYTTNLGNKSIEVYNIRNLAKTVFYFRKFPYFITLVPEESKMFVMCASRISGKENDLFLYKMNMDGLGKEVLIKKNFRSLQISMDYDRNSKTLFVSDQLAGCIYSYSNEDKFMRVFRTGLRMPTSLAVTGNKIYWIEQHSKQLFWTETHIFSNHKEVAFYIPEPFTRVTMTQLYMITLRKDAKQEHDCQKNNGNCSHVCLSSSINSFICACPPGMELLNDNRTCIVHHECSKNEYKCSEHNLCIKKEKLCDGITDCPNGEDESKDCEEKGKHCKEDQFMCKNGECISWNGRCNSIFDCTDQSDEKDCELKCKNDEYQCHDGTCILNSKLCDHYPDCPDMSDELSSICISRTCAPNEFKCDINKCIPKFAVCDNELDCLDGKDEEKCATMTSLQCPSGYFQCHNGNCISSSLVCDDAVDCRDGSDERYCLNKPIRLVNCTANQYHCVNTDMCLPKAVRCNGVYDCPKLDDEHNCANCYENEFTCDNAKCIPETWLCDKKDDCGDKSDEKNCDGSKKIINEFGECNEFKCSVGTCLPYSKVCDGSKDCPDSSDENGKCQKACVIDNYCKGICHKTPRGAICDCQDGYRLAADKITCEDINECERNVCSQICRNTPGSYDCSCHDGYIIRNDKVSCKAVGSPMEFITTTENDIRKISSNLHLVEIIDLLADSTVSGLDVNVADGFVYWSNDDFGTIKKININTKESTTFTIVEHPQALAIDWITDNVYVVDNIRPNTIKVCDLNENKQKCATLVKIEDNAKAMSLVVDPINRWLFWSQVTWPTEKPFSKIYRADMMGADAKVIFFHEGFVSGITIDHIKSKLYWLDSFHRNIESSNLDGSQHSTFSQTNTIHHHSFIINIYEQSLWFSNFDGQLVKCKLYGDKSCATIHLGTNNFHKYLVIFHISRQPSGKNPCDEENCKYMCVQKKDNATCICSDGRSIESNSICTINVNDIKISRNNSLRNTRHISGIYSVTIIVLLVGVLLLCVYYYYQKNKLKSKSKTNDFSCGPIHFQNPSYNRSDEVEATLNSVASDLAPGQHEYVNPIDDKVLKTAIECSVRRSISDHQCLEEKDVQEIEKENKILIHFGNTKLNN